MILRTNLKISILLFSFVLYLSSTPAMAQEKQSNASSELSTQVDSRKLAKQKKKRERFEKRWLKKLDRAEYYHEKGYYKTASFMMKTWVRKESRKEPNSTLMASSLIARAKYLEGLGNYDRSDEVFRRGIKLLDSNRVDPDYRLLGLNLASEAMQERGQYYYAYYLSLLSKYQIGKQISVDLSSDAIDKASYIQDSTQSFQKHLKQLENITQAVNKIPASSNYKNELFFEVDLNLVKINEARGFYNRGITAIDTLIDHLSATLLTEKKDLNWREKKSLESRKADLLVTKADLYSSRGDYPTANELYAKNSGELKKLVSRRDKSVIRNNLGYALSIRDNELSGNAKKYMKYAFKRAKRSNDISKTSQLFYEVFEEQMAFFQEQRKRKKYKKTAHKYRRTILLKYRRNSPFYWRYRLFENELLIYFDMRFKKAERKAYKIRSKLLEYYPEDHINNILLNDQLYAIYVRQNRYDEARQLLNENNKISAWNMGPQSPVYHMSKLDLAMFEITFGSNFAKAEAIYDTSFNQIIRPELHEHHRKMLPYLNKYGSLYEKTDRFDKAIVVFNEALGIAKDRFAQRSLKYGTALERLAGTYIKAGEYDKAEEMLELAVEVVKGAAGRRSIEYVTALRSLGELYSINGKYEEARKVIELSYKLSKRVSDEAVEVPEINSIEEMADLYITTGNYEDALDILKESLKSRTSKFGEKSYQLIKPYQLLGKVYLLKGNFIEAEKNAKTASEVALSTLSDTASSYIESVALLAEIHAEMGRFSDARENLNTTLEGTEKIFGENHINVAAALDNIAELELARSSDPKAIDELLQRALKIYANKLGEDHPDYGRTLELIAINLIRQGKYDAAKIKLEKARLIYLQKFGENSIYVGDNEMRLGELSYFAENYVEAASRFEDALDIYKKVFDKYHPKFVKAQGNLARAYYSMGEFKDCADILENTSEKYLEYIEEYFPSLSDKEKNKYWNNIRGDFELYNSLALRYSKEKPSVIGDMYNNKLATKAILLSSSIKVRQNIMSSENDELIQLYEDWLRKKELLTKSFSMSQEELVLKGINRDALAKEINNLEKALSKLSESFASSKSETYEWKDILKSLDENEIAIEIIRFNYFDKSFTDSIIYAALILKPDFKKGPELHVLPNGNLLESRYYKGYRNSIKYKIPDKYSYEKFWKVIDQEIENNKTIFLSADGVYNQMNVETLKDPDGKFVIDKNDVVLVSNTKDIVIFRDEQEEKKSSKDEIDMNYLSSTAALFGNPDFTSDAKASDVNSSNTVSSFEPLPGAEEEVKQLNEILKEKEWNTETFINKEATEAQVKKLQSPRVFHIATHGFFVQESSVQDDILMEAKSVDNPLLKSGLLFSGSADLLGENIYNFNKREGVLTAYEAMNLKLDNTELVVLSACETGLGEVKAGEGVYGLQRSFLVAGAQNIIMTLFKVDDQVTQELITNFYKYWLSTGNKRVAFNMAKKQIKNKYPEPIFWGSFVMIGMN